MKKADTPKTIKQILEPYPVIEEGGENLPSTKPLDEPQEVLPSMVTQAIKSAVEGDEKSWATLYIACAAILKEGKPIAQPLRTIMVDRLQAIGHALINPPSADLRAGLLGAVSPMPEKKVRLVGAKPKLMKLDALALDVLRYKESGLSLKAAARKVAQLLPKDPQTGLGLYPASSLEATAKRVRKKQVDAEKKTDK